MDSSSRELASAIEGLKGGGGVDAVLDGWVDERTDGWNTNAVG